MEKLLLHIFPVIMGFLLDLLLGDPQRWPHPVRLIGKIIEYCERILRPACGENKTRLFISGMFTSVVVVIAAFMLPFLILWVAGIVNIWLRLVLETVFCYQIIAVKSLRDESMRVYSKLTQPDIEGARFALSRIVGRDTERLDSTQITKAAVETVAENCSDGVIAPLLYMCIGGAPLGFAYKAVNTLDSMLGYKNERYLFFGKFAARLDDIAGFIPARLCALFMLIAGAVLQFNVKNGIIIFRRDRLKHLSPNSAQSEAMCAGLLSVELAGNAYYGGKLVLKPAIGEPLRPITAEDIKKTNKLMYLTAAVGLAIFCAVAGAIWLLLTKGGF